MEKNLSFTEAQPNILTSMTSSLTPISETIKHKKRQIAGRWIKCHLCSGDAIITLEEGRYFVSCLTCNFRGYLKCFSALDKGQKK